MISIKNLRKTFEVDGQQVIALNDLTLEIPRHSFFTLLGPSGCGKTTLMRCIAGLEDPTSGVISINGRTVYSAEDGINIPPNKRRIGMVFQSYAIWPHMTVFENVAFPLRVQRKTSIERKVKDALELVDLGGLSQRYASKLSGGQQQRVAFARAIVADPEVLMLDEPLSNLDAALRDTMRSEMKRLQQRLNLTTVYVTHDQSEALSLSDQIVLMKSGNFVEIATPKDLYHRPTTAFGAQFIGGSNVLQGKVSSDANPIGLTVETPLGPLISSNKTGSTSPLVFVRPSCVLPLAPGDARPACNVLDLKLVSKSFVGGSWELELAVEAHADTLRAHMTDGDSVDVGSNLLVHIRPADVRLLARD